MADDEPRLSTLDYRGTIPAAQVAPSGRYSPIGSLISTANAFLGIVLIPIGVLYLVDLTEQGTALVAAGVLLILSTMRYIATDKPRFWRSFAASTIALMLLAGVAVLTSIQMSNLSDQQWDAFARVQQNRKLAADTDVAWLSFIRTTATIATAISFALWVWIVVQLFTRRAGRTIEQ